MVVGLIIRTRKTCPRKADPRRTLTAARSVRTVVSPMLKRLFLGLVLGVVLGGLLGYGLFQVLPDAMTGVLGYPFAAAAGVLVGLVAGKPIWAKGAAIEAGLKAFVGALLSMGILFGLSYAPLPIPAFAGLPAAALGKHAVLSLTAITTLLAIFYELDNTGGAEGPPKKRVATPGGKQRVASGDDALAEDEPVEDKRARR